MRHKPSESPATSRMAWHYSPSFPPPIPFTTSSSLSPALRTSRRRPSVPSKSSSPKRTASPISNASSVERKSWPSPRKSSASFGSTSSPPNINTPPPASLSSIPSPSGATAPNARTSRGDSRALSCYRPAMPRLLTLLLLLSVLLRTAAGAFSPATQPRASLLSGPPGDPSGGTLMARYDYTPWGARPVVEPRPAHRSRRFPPTQRLPSATP